MTTESPTPAKSCEASDLVLAHQAFRRLYALAPDAVRSTDPADRRRVAAVATTLLRINDALHHHHTLEDTMVWDTLSERRPACGLHVELMKRQHGQVAGLMAESTALVSAWRQAPGPATAEALAAKFAEIDALLTIHLDTEEAKIVPVIEQVMTTGEWEAVGSAAASAYSPAQSVLLLGLILEILPERERTQFEAELPGPLKFVWALVGRHLYQRMMDRLRPAAAA